MRLLNTQTLRLEEFYGQIPPYAILSHCWEADEVTFEDVFCMSDPNGPIAAKAGWLKIRGCCQQALSQDHRYIWVDTCCINKSSSAELSEAINSMFQWYHDAQVCLVYLCDVAYLSGVAERDEDSLLRSRWFTRGWTLQELIAPSNVDFYDADWQKLTSRTLLANKIQASIGIDAALLLGKRLLHTYSVAQRFSWAAQRETTRVEDRAYSLLGIFGVNMPLLYGEGVKAFHRLQEEVMRLTQDLSILAWPGFLSKDENPPLATSLNSFADCKNVVLYMDSFEHYFNNSEIVLSPRSLRLTVKLVNLSALAFESESGIVAMLNSRYADDITRVLGLKIKLLSHLSWQDIAQSSDPVQCVVDVSNRLSRDRLVLVDIIDVKEHGVTKTVLIQRVPQVLPKFDVKLQFSHLWLRFNDPRHNKRWTTEDVFPSHYWTSSNRTFDLTAARTDEMYNVERKMSDSQSSRIDPPVHGAIVVSNSQDRFLVQFREHSRIWNNDRILFKISRYHGDAFSSLEWNFVNDSDEQPQSIKLSDGSLFQVELRAHHMTDDKIALLAVTIEGCTSGSMSSLRDQVSAMVHAHKRHK